MVRTTLALGLVLLALAGCSQERSVVGKWTTKQTPEQRKEQNVAVNAAASFLTSELTVRKDHTFTLSLLGSSAEGTWTLDGDQLKLKTDTTAGIELTQLGIPAQQWIGTLSASGQELEFKTRQGPVSTSVIFNRAPEE